MIAHCITNRNIVFCYRKISQNDYRRLRKKNFCGIVLETAFSLNTQKTGEDYGSVFLGDYIRRQREARGLSQRELCEGICEPITISRMETGKQTPSHSNIVAILERLGIPNDRYFTLLSSEEREISALKKQITSFGVRYDITLEEEKETARRQAYELLEKLEALTKENDRITQQYILQTKALLGTPEGPYAFEDALEILMRAIRLTVPGFDLENINRFFYSLDEIKTINQIACAYGESGQHKKAVDILSQLLLYVRNNNQNITHAGGNLPLVAHNYSLELVFCKRYEDAIEAAEEGIRASRNCGYYQSLPGLMHIIAECYHLLGDDEKSADLYYQAYYFYKGIGNERDRVLLREEAKKSLGIDFR